MKNGNFDWKRYLIPGAIVLVALIVLLVVLLPGGETAQPTDPTGTSGTVPTTEASTPTTGATTPTTEATQPTETDPVLNYINPLTGEAIAEPVMARPFAVILNNVKPAMPMWGVGSADILYETVAEGGATRCLGIFSDISSVQRVGSIRSARPYFINVAMSYDAIFTHIGGSDSAYELLKSSGWDEIDGNRGPVTKYFTSDKDRYNSGTGIEHTYYITGEGALEAAIKKGCAVEREDPMDYGLVFSENVTLDGEAANMVQVKFGGTSKITKMTYNSTTGKYEAYQHGGDFVDGDTGEVLSFTNVIILNVASGYESNNKVHTLQLTGSGEGKFACGGKIVSIKWSRATADDPFTYTLEDGTPLTLGVGKTYIALAPNKSVISCE